MMNSGQPGAVAADRAPARTVIGLAVALVGIALLSASCIRVDVGIRVNDDGGGTVSFLTAIDSSAAGSLAKSLGGTSSDSDSGFTNIDKSTLPAGSTVEPYKEGKYEGARVTTPFRPGDDIAAIVNQISSSTSSAESGGVADPGSSSPLFEEFSLAKEGEGWTFKATISPENDITSGTGDLVSPEQLKVLFKDASFTVRVKLPGSVTSHNADSVKNGELIWKIDIFATKARTLSARTGPSKDGGFPTAPVVGGVAAVAVLVALAGFIAARRRRVAVESAASTPLTGAEESEPAPGEDSPTA